MGNLVDLNARMAETDRQAVREVASLDTLPAYDLAVSGPGGVLWLREFPRPQDTTVVWLELDSAGKPQGTVRLSRGSEVKAVTAGELAVLERDAFDAPVVRLLHVYREPAGVP